MNKGAMFLGMGFELVAVCMGGYYFGNYVDAYMGWETKSSAYLILLLLIGWFYHLILLIKKFESDDDNPSSSGPGSQAQP